MKEPTPGANAEPAPPGAQGIPGLHNAYVFAIFNALSFQMVVSSPMVLYAKTLGASATILGIITGMMPLLVVFQIPAAQYIGRIGYRRFVCTGWGARTAFIFVLAGLPLLTGWIQPASQMGLLLLILFGYNLARGISSCAWLPWLATLVPSEQRGRYLTREAACVNLASTCAFVLAGLLLGNGPNPWQFSVLFGFAAVMGLVSLTYLARIPDVEVSPVSTTRTSGTGVPWLAMARYRPFQKLLWLNFGWSIAYGGAVPFTVAFLKSEVGMSEQQTLFVTAVMFLGGLCSLWLLGPGMDRWGSKPIISLTLAFWVGVTVVWSLIAGHALQAHVWIVILLQFFMGLMAALFNMANTRLVMAVTPVMGRDHFFALFSVVGSMTLGLSPILWGILIDACERVDLTSSGFKWNRFSLYYTGATAAFLLAAWLASRLEEPKAASMENLWRDMLNRSPLKVWLKIWPRA